MPCRPHINVKLTIQICNEISARANTCQASIDRDEPINIRIVATCPDCGFSSVYNAHAHTQHAGATAWPHWLIERMWLLMNESRHVNQACINCHMPQP